MLHFAFFFLRLLVASWNKIVFCSGLRKILERSHLGTKTAFHSGLRRNSERSLLGTKLVWLWTSESFGDRGCFSKQKKRLNCILLWTSERVRHETAWDNNNFISSTTTTTMMASKDKDTCTSKESNFLPCFMTSQCIVDQWTPSQASGFFASCVKRSLLLEITNHSPLVNGTHT